MGAELHKTLSKGFYDGWKPKIGSSFHLIVIFLPY